MAWFVSSGTVALLQPFTNLLPNGTFAHHSGYLQHVIDSESDVVFDSKLSCNELEHIIASDLKGAIPPHRLFVSRAFDRNSYTAGPTARVEGRAIRFSLNERVADALKRPLEGLQFSETQWLHDLEDESMVFTIVLPVEHPDVPHVLNWIEYRQIWFPHRVVHIKAQLHVMHTERHERPRSCADLSAISPDALDQLERLLRHERLVQLSGPPGCGKTTLASRFHRDARAREEGGLVAPTPKSDDVSSQKETCSAPVSCQFARLKRFSVTTQTDQLLMFLEADCDALLVVEEFNLQNDGWW
ncbi:MAG: hypothetical protein ACOVOX_02860, partial [Burkholderiaceae bacterium]